MTRQPIRSEAQTLRRPVRSWPAEVHHPAVESVSRRFTTPRFNRTDMQTLLSDVRCWVDSVAKVVLPKASKILRAAGAVFIARSEGPHRLTQNS